MRLLRRNPLASLAALLLAASVAVYWVSRPADVGLPDLGIEPGMIWDASAAPRVNVDRLESREVAVRGQIWCPTVAVHAPPPGYGDFKIICEGSHDWASGESGVWCKAAAPRPSAFDPSSEYQVTGTLHILRGLAPGTGLPTRFYRLDATRVSPISDLDYSSPLANGLLLAGAGLALFCWTR